jgi:hypothetical protein
MYISTYAMGLNASERLNAGWSAVHEELFTFTPVLYGTPNRMDGYYLSGHAEYYWACRVFLPKEYYEDEDASESGEFLMEYFYDDYDGLWAYED